ncbi:MAG: hypothetical protein ABSF95_23855, partial [Verrucomicrobiota bacterium]
MTGVLFLAFCLGWFWKQPPVATSAPPSAPLLAEPEPPRPSPSALSSLPGTTPTPQRPYRLSNTSQPLGQLVRNPNAILLENALLDTTQPANLPIPASLRAQGDPGAYLVQARGPLDESFRALLRQAGARMVCYIPNNACLVRASQAVARQLAAAPQTQAVLPYEPYYKLKPWLLQAALDQVPLPG